MPGLSEDYKAMRKRRLKKQRVMVHVYVTKEEQNYACRKTHWQNAQSKIVIVALVRLMVFQRV